MRIGIDLDSTLIIGRAIDFAAKDLGYEFKEEHNVDYGLSYFPEDMRQRVFEMFEDPKIMCDLVEPIEGSQETIKKWNAEGHDLILITARNLNIGKETIELVKRLYPEIKDINIIGMSISKEACFISKFLDVWIDDNPRDLIIAKKLGIRTIMISNKYTKYNQKLINDFETYKKVQDIIL